MATKLVTVWVGDTWPIRVEIEATQPAQDAVQMLLDVVEAVKNGDKLEAVAK